MIKKIIAHKNDENIQTLKEHLFQVAGKARKIGKKIGIEKITILVSLLHDLGKSDRNFQNYIYNGTNEKINHSSAGARFLFEKVRYFVEKNLKLKKDWLLFLEIMEYVIFSHHGLYDVISSEGESRTIKRRNYDKEKDDKRKYYYEEDVKKYIKDLEVDENVDFNKYISEAFEEFEIIFKKINDIIKEEKLDQKLSEKNIKEIEEEKRFFYYSCIVRLILSILKEADINDTENFFQEENIEKFSEKEILELWDKIGNNINEKYESFEKNSKKTKINELRKSLSENARKRGKIDTSGVYKLELPTGSGKTLTSFRYAIEQAKFQKKDRIIYITAFLSVLEQNAEEIKGLVKNDDYVLEHHSNITQEGNDSKETENYEKYKEILKRQYLLNSWDSPVILTTMVQFYNTLFKDKSSNIRRFSKLINSVIIVDEVQSLPKKTIYISNLMTNFLKYFMNCTVIHCTATQPSFDKDILEHRVIYGNKNGENTDIVKMNEKERNVFERVKVYNLAGKNGIKTLETEKISNFIIEKYEENESILVILNTKKAVKKIYDNLKEKLENYEGNLYYLSTNMCATHRLEKIKEIKQKLSENKKIICVSTQLIEAGVDVDFNVVIRSITGIDSIIQSIGRCNREGKLDKGKFYIVNYSEENFKYLKEIKNSIEATSKILGEEIDNIEKLRDNYYSGYYINNLEELRYKIGSDDLLSILSKNTVSRSEYKKRYGRSYNNYQIAQSFKTAALKFNLIDNETDSIIVNYDKYSDELIKKLREAIKQYEIADIKKILKKLQRYTVNAYNIENMKEYLEQYKEYGIHILLDEYYGETGIEKEELSTLII